MSHDEGRVCACVAEHRPSPLELNLHHILPLGMGGLDVPSNTVWLCPTGHGSVHEILREICRRGGSLSWGEATALWDRPVSRYAFALAHEGYARFLAL